MKERFTKRLTKRNILSWTAGVAGTVGMVYGGVDAYVTEHRGSARAKIEAFDATGRPDKEAREAAYKRLDKERDAGVKKLNDFEFSEVHEATDETDLSATSEKEPLSIEAAKAVWREEQEYQEAFDLHRRAIIGLPLVRDAVAGVIGVGGVIYFARTRNKEGKKSRKLVRRGLKWLLTAGKKEGPKPPTAPLTPGQGVPGRV